MKDDRTAADYDEVVLPSPGDARQAIAAAEQFLAVCDARYGFRAL
jgi:hypothetical protein